MDRLSDTLTFICGGSASDPEQGHIKPCPLRISCGNVTQRAARERVVGPYDFDDETCVQYREVSVD